LELVEADVDPPPAHSYIEATMRELRLAVATAVTPPSPLALIRELAQLGKPRLTGLVLATTSAGLWLAPGHVHPARAVLVVLASAAVVSAANALNCYLERDSDALMRRTRDRPLPAGRLEPVVALAYGLMVPVFAVPVLALAAGPLTALLALVALATYVVVYTPLKRRSSLALFVGTIPGAIPPLMGWTSVTGRLDGGGLALFALLLAWQLPHFLAISLYLREDYARGGLKVFSLVHGEQATRRWIAGTSLLLLPVALLPVAVGLAGWGYGAAAAVLSLAFAGLALGGLGRRGGSAHWARQVFLATLLYLPLVLVALLVGAGP
jgi:protoheme IX farnesyltransferase